MELIQENTCIRDGEDSLCAPEPFLTILCATGASRVFNVLDNGFLSPISFGR